ncbi:Histone-lysine N-methyltransferase, H3 lysine-79 specific [Balamuthia mandrillaris]
MATSTSVTTSAAQAPALRKQLGRDGVRSRRPSTVRPIAPANNLALSFPALAVSTNPSPPVIGGTLVYSPATIAEGTTATTTGAATGSILTTASPLPLRLPRQTNPTQPRPQQKQIPSQQQKTNRPHLSPTVSQQRHKQPPLSLARNLPNVTNNNPAATNGNASSPMLASAVGVKWEQERQVDASNQQPLVQKLLCLINDQKQQEQVLQQKVQVQAAFLKQMEVLQHLQVQCQQQQQLLQLQRLHQLQEEQRRLKEQEEERERQMKESELLKRWEEQRQVQLRYLQEQQLQKSLEQQLQKKLTLQPQQYERQEVLQPQPQLVCHSSGELIHRTTDQLQNQQQVQELPQPQLPPHQLLQSLSSQTESLASLLQEAVQPETPSSQVDLLQLLKNLSSQRDMLSVLQHTDPAQHEKILHIIRHLLALCYTSALTASSSAATPSVSPQSPSQLQLQSPAPAEPQTPHQLLLPQQQTKAQIKHVSNNTQPNRSSQPHSLTNSPSPPLPFTTASPYLTSSFSPLSNLTKTNVPPTVKLSTPREKESTKREKKVKTLVERTESAKNNSENAKNNCQRRPAIFCMRIGGFDYLKELGLELVVDALKRQEQREMEEGIKQLERKNGKPANKADKKVRQQLKEERRQKRKVLKEERRQQRFQIRELKRNNRLKKRRNRVTSNKASSARKAEPPSFLPPPTLLPSPQRTERVETSPETAKEEEEIKKMAEAARKRVYGGHSFDGEDEDEEERDEIGNDDDDPANNEKEKEVKHGDISVMDERRRLALASLKRLNYLKPTKEERRMKKEWRKELREQRKREKERKRKEREHERESKQQQKKVKLWTREERRKQLLNNSNNNMNK